MIMSPAAPALGSKRRANMDDSCLSADIYGSAFQRTDEWKCSNEWKTLITRMDQFLSLDLLCALVDVEETRCVS
jgi:hypothetical protein